MKEENTESTTLKDLVMLGARKPAQGPLIDDLTQVATAVLRQGEGNVVETYRGPFFCAGCQATNRTPHQEFGIRGHRINTGLVHILAFHRKEVPSQDLRTLKEELARFGSAEPTPDELLFPPAWKQTEEEADGEKLRGP